MPPSSPGSLGEVAYVNLTAFLLEANGGAAGTEALRAATNLAIGSVVSGKMPASLEAKLNAAANANQAGAPAVAIGPKGLTVSGEVKKFVPVTDAMLENPAPGDWLMIRRNYQAWSYSPLSEIDANNVKGLQLAWVWSMNDGGASQPTPIVHDGIIYLSNTSNTVQAIDGRNGELI